MKTIATFLIAVAMLFAPSLSAGAKNGFGPLIDAKELADAIEADAPLLIDIRGASTDLDSPLEFGHIQGSVSAPYDLFRGPAENPGQLVSIEDLQATLRVIGVERERPTVIVYEGTSEADFGAAARVYWTLKSSGVEEIAILNGGLTAWINADLPLEWDVEPSTPSMFTVAFSEEWRATTAEVREIVEQRAQARLIDARPASAAPTTLPGATRLEHSEFFAADGQRLASLEAISARAAQAGLSLRGETVISFCNTGQLAATTWFALSEVAGIEGVKLYPESMTGYARADETQTQKAEAAEPGSKI